jgi:hypothetical protein
MVGGLAYCNIDPRLMSFPFSLSISRENSGPSPVHSISPGSYSLAASSSSDLSALASSSINYHCTGFAYSLAISSINYLSANAADGSKRRESTAEKAQKERRRQWWVAV